METDPLPPPDLARHILDRMGSVGQPPERGALFVNVATEGILDTLRDEYLRPIKRSGRNSTFKLVQAPFGGGKSQFLHCLRELAWREGFCTALVGLSPKECPFDQPASIYREVARRIELPVLDFDVDPNPGLDRLLRQLAEERIAEAGAEAFTKWVQGEFARANIESRSFQRAIALYLAAVAASDEDRLQLVGDYLLGEELSSNDLAPLQLREAFSDSVAFRWLRSLAQALVALQLPGVVLMFDEMDRNLSLSVRRRRAIGDNLRQMIDYCGQSMLPGVVWCYAVPPEFMDTIVPEYPALAQRLKGPLEFSHLSPNQPLIDLDHLPLPTEELLSAIGARLVELTERAYGVTLQRGLQAANLGQLARELAARQFESGTRRTFVKAAVSHLEAQRRGGEAALSRRDVESLAGAHTESAFEPLSGEVEF
jgi:hypothetical protein